MPFDNYLKVNEILDYLIKFVNVTEQIRLQFIDAIKWYLNGPRLYRLKDFEADEKDRTIERILLKKRQLLA